MSMEDAQMHITVCICTRDRGAAITRTITSIAQSDFGDFDAIIVDQSMDADTEDAVRHATMADPRFTYVRSQTVGSSAARNIALLRACGPIVALTDDDCEVTPTWLAHIADSFAHSPDVGHICGAVWPGPHDPRTEFVPDCPITHRYLLSSPWQAWRGHGISANMAFRLDVLATVGLFDELLGAGGPLLSGADFDLTYRVLRAGFTVLYAPDIAVIHHGFRPWAEARRLVRNNGFGIGAVNMKHLRHGDLAILPTLMHDFIRTVSWPRVLTMRRHCGLVYCLWYLRGIAHSVHYSIDPKRLVYWQNPARREEGARALIYAGLRRLNGIGLSAMHGHHAASMSLIMSLHLLASVGHAVRL